MTSEIDLLLDLPNGGQRGGSSPKNFQRCHQNVRDFQYRAIFGDLAKRSAIGAAARWFCSIIISISAQRQFIEAILLLFFLFFLFFFFLLIPGISQFAHDIQCKEAEPYLLGRIEALIEGLPCIAQRFRTWMLAAPKNRRVDE